MDNNINTNVCQTKGELWWPSGLRHEPFITMQLQNPGHESSQGPLSQVISLSLSVQASDFAGDRSLCPIINRKINIPVTNLEFTFY